VKITIESTDRIVNLHGPSGGAVPARVWQGHTDSGIPVHCFVTRIAVAKDQDATQFERELQEHAPPRRDVAAIFPQGIPLRLVL
jgi:hypothetical protein